MTHRMTFWGTRGSIPTPGAHTARYGGNTPCISLEPLDGGSSRALVLDAGTGIRQLGNLLTRNSDRSVDVDLFLSHTHWDHIQGLPFFAPLFDDGSTIRIWGPAQGDVTLESILRRQMDPVVFPVPLEGSGAKVSVAHVEDGRLEVAGFTVETLRLRHPGCTLGYRITSGDGGLSLAYVTDNELGSGGAYDVPASWRASFVRFLRGVDVLVHDAMYTPAEVERHRGWGHSSSDEAVVVAAEAGARQLIDGSLEVVAATDGLELTL
jgi:phosphoribosyl 1,2-cyclic phosphodiesterase